MKILAVHFSYKKQLEQEINVQCLIVKTENIVRLWRMRILTTEGNVLVFKSLVISKIFYLSLITALPHAIINQLNIIQKLYMERKKSRTKTLNFQTVNKTVC